MTTAATFEQHHVLVVDDEEPLRRALAQYLEHRNFRVSTAATGEEALGIVRQGGLSLMLVDVRILGPQGADIVPGALSLDPDLAIVMLASARHAAAAAICMQRGACDYLTKPIELTDLGAGIDRALRRRDTLRQHRELAEPATNAVPHETPEWRRDRDELERVTTATLEALVNVLESKTGFLRGHSARVASFAASIAHEMGLADDAVEAIRLAGRLHDLGKIGIREDVLEKEGPLTPEEYEHVKQHVLVGARILEPFAHLGPVASYVRTHHEYWDGGGYPNGTQGDDIPLGGRIICAAEIYDALTTSRPYQEQLSPDAATERMRMLSGSVIDPAVMEALDGVVSRRQTLVFLQEEHHLPADPSSPPSPAS